MAVQVEDAIAFLKEAGITGAARAAVTTLLGSVSEAHKTPPALEFRSEAVISKVSDAWGQLVVQPPGAAPVLFAMWLGEMACRRARQVLSGGSCARQRQLWVL